MKERRPFDVVLFNLFALLFVPFALELALGLTDPGRKLPFDGFLDGTLYTWGHEVTINREGFRERDVATPKPPGVFRIMVLGDSLTWGIGVSTNERYSGVLEARLQAAWPDRRVEALAFAMPGFSMLAYRATMELYLDQITPDLVLVGFCYNDPQPRLQEHSAELEAFEARHPFLARGIRPALEKIGFPYLGKRLQLSVLNTAVSLGLFPRWMEALDRAYHKLSPEWIAFVEHLRAIRLMVEQRGLPPPIFLVLNQVPNPVGRAARNPDLQTYARWYAQAEEAAAQNGWVTANCADLLPADAPPSWFVVNAVDAHPSPALHAIYAQRAAEIILSSVGRSRAESREDFRR